MWTANFVGAFSHMLKNSISWLIVFLVSGIVVMVEILLQILPTYMNEPTPTDLLTAYEHDLGPLNKNGTLKSLELRSESKSRMSSLSSLSSLSNNTDDADDADDVDDVDDYDDGAHVADESAKNGSEKEEDQHRLTKKNSIHSGTSRTSKIRKRRTLNISGKHLLHLSSTMNLKTKTQMGLRSLE